MTTTTDGTTADFTWSTTTTATNIWPAQWGDQYNNIWIDTLGDRIPAPVVAAPNPDGDACERLRGMRERRDRGLEVAV